MKYKPILYCPALVVSDVRKASGNLSFWSIQSSQPEEADLVLSFTADTLCVKGVAKTFEKDYNIGNIFAQITPLDLSYIEQLFDKQDEQLAMLRLAKSELAIGLHQLTHAVTCQEPIRIKHAAHKLISKLLLLSIPAVESCHYLEEHADDFSTPIFQEHYNILKVFSLIRLHQIWEK